MEYASGVVPSKTLLSNIINSNYLWGCIEGSSAQQVNMDHYNNNYYVFSSALHSHCNLSFIYSIIKQTSYSFVFTTDDECWSSEKCIANLIR